MENRLPSLEIGEARNTSNIPKMDIMQMHGCITTPVQRRGV